MEHSRVLVVDDEPDIVQTLKFRLEAAGYEVLTAENGARALEAMQGREVDLILADFMMPEMNGIELTRMIKSHPTWFDVKVVLFSCNTEPEFRRRAIEMGAVDYLPKTIGASSIVERIFEIVGPERGTRREEPAGVDGELKASLVALSRSLIDVLHLARAGEGIPETTAYALDSARRIADDMLRLTGSGELQSVDASMEQHR